MTTAELALLPDNCTPCRARLDARRTWSRTLAVRSGPAIMGIRCDTPATAELLDSVFASVRLPHHDDEAAPTWSVELDSEGDRPRRLFLAYRDHEVVARRYDKETLLDDLTLLLDELPRAGVSGAPLIHGSVLSTDKGRAIVMPPVTHRNLISRRRDFERAGLHVLPSRMFVLEGDRGLVLNECQDPDLRSIRETIGVRSALPPRLEVEAWCLHVRSDEPTEMPAADAVFLAAQTVLNRQPEVMQHLLGHLAALQARVPFVAMPFLSAGAQVLAVDAVRDMLRYAT